MIQKERVRQRRIVNGKGVYQRRPISAEWKDIDGFGEAFDSVYKVKRVLTYGLKAQLLVEKSDLFEEFHLVERMVTYDVSKEGIWNYQTELLSIGDVYSVGSYSYEPLGIIQYSIIDFRVCLFSCDSYNGGVLGYDSY
ncbi:hypothetical protein ECB94_19100 [Vibrio mediterranei]|uniref:Uncharacterized protein n=1 Tax=Vibrio mediterranei TaxID=689 RepID=A0A3G4VF67_9VIBR|nr:hypothetical protein ECB94_19100 [Vibrio mediterranei]